MRATVKTPGVLLDVLAEMFPDSSRTTLRQMLQNGRVRVNGEIEKNARAVVEGGDELSVGQKSTGPVLPPELTILHEDDDLVVVFKQHGLLTVATERQRETTAQAYLNEYLKRKKEGRIHVVHRLDRETSGVLVFAKSFDAREALKEQFAAHDVERSYVAVIEGELSPKHGSFRSWIRERRDLRMESVPAGTADAKEAVTHYRTAASNARHSLLEVTLETGRKNQIRLHLAESGHPIVGDRLYGSRENPLGRLGLHARVLGFAHPGSGEKMHFSVPEPKPFRDLVR
jgi:23S rRNA pseudouridine1911/1915/1917 synthase